MTKVNSATRVIFLVVAIVTFAAIIIFRPFAKRERSFVILSTNDMHAQIDKFPALATAIEICRDTTEVILVDAGDRWTGNAFVDRVEHYTPIYELMNKLGYDLATFGNHEFDKGQAYLAEANRQASFEIIGASITSDTTSFPQPLSHYFMDVEGCKIAFVGTVGNYDGSGHPAGKEESFLGLHFSDPLESAAKYSSLRDECDMLVLVSHCGLERDREFAASEQSKGYDLILSAHSHDVANESVNSIKIVQSGSRLKNVTATRVTVAKDGSISLATEIIPLANYERDPEVEAMVEGYHQNTELTKSIGTLAEKFDSNALRNLFTSSIKRAARCDIGVYHRGGVRLEQIAAGDVSLSTVLNIEPFSSYVATASMSVDQLKQMVMTKYNDPKNVGEAHQIDLVMTTPYTILTDTNGDAVSVEFPELDPKRRYSVAMGDYIFKTYKGLEYTKGKITELLITDILEKEIKSHDSMLPNNTIYQSEAPQTAEKLGMAQI